MSPIAYCGLTGAVINTACGIAGMSDADGILYTVLGCIAVDCAVRVAVIWRRGR